MLIEDRFEDVGGLCGLSKYFCFVGESIGRWAGVLVPAGCVNDALAG